MRTQNTRIQQIPQGSRLLTVTALALFLAACGQTGANIPGDTALNLEPNLTTAAVTIQAVSASAAEVANPASNATDTKLETRWSAPGDGQWIQLDLGKSMAINSVQIAWYKGNQRKAFFDLQTSSDGASFSNILTNKSTSGVTNALQTFDFGSSNARFVRIVGHGNTENMAAAITEVSIGAGSSTPAPTPVPTPAPTPAPTPTPGPIGNGELLVKAPSGTSYYVDCAAGNDGNTGTSPSSAWQSVNKANAAALVPGQSLLFKRGCNFAGPLRANWKGTSSSPIFIGAYGSGNAPMIRNGSPAVVSITGEYQAFDNLEVSADQPGPYKNAQKCKTTPTGWRVGFEFSGNSQFNTVQQSKASGLTAGVRFGGGSRNRAVYNALVNNNVISQNTPPSEKYDDDSGAWGVLLNANNNEVAYNTFSGNSNCSEDYGIEGASVEIYQGSGNYIHHNKSINDSTFSELGGTPDRYSRDNVFAYNLYAPVTTGGELLVLRGLGSKWGANPGTKFYNNTAYMVTVGISCSDGCNSSILSARNNIIVSRSNTGKGALWADGMFDEGNNIYWRVGGSTSARIEGGSIAASSKITDPKFANAANYDFHLAAGSPAINAGSEAVVQALKITTDVDGKTLPASGVDIGASEY
jgi:F5/8 type C domain